MARKEYLLMVMAMMDDGANAFTRSELVRNSGKLELIGKIRTFGLSLLRLLLGRLD